MNVSEVMTPNPVTVKKEDSLLSATKLLKDKGFKHLPVVNGGGRLEGIVTDRDLKRASASNATSLEMHELLYLLDKVKIADMMNTQPVTVAAGETVQNAARIILERKIGCLLVTQDGTLAGIVTKGDLLKLLAQG